MKIKSRKLNIAVVLALLIVISIFLCSTSIAKAVEDTGYYTITWNTYGDYVLKLYFVDEDGNNLMPDISGNIANVSGLGSINVNNYASYLSTDLQSEWTHLCNYININDSPESIKSISYNHTGNGSESIAENWHYIPSGRSSWLIWDGMRYSTTAEVYIVYTKLVDNKVHNDIEINLYNYGSQINELSESVLRFYDTRSYAALDGKISSIVDTETGKSAGSPPDMKKTLINDAPYVTYSAGSSGSLEYLFYKTGDNFRNSGSGLTSYGTMSSQATWDSENGYNTAYASMRFDLNGDGGLFKLDDSGYYTYDCTENSAYYNIANNKFEVYNNLVAPGHRAGITVSSTTNINHWWNFLPFNKPAPAYGSTTVNHPVKTDKKVYFLGWDGTGTYKNTEVADFWFGMSLEMAFYQPKDGYVKNSKTDETQKMVFEFSGDDDVWVYIDNVLVLDIGGCKGAVPATIDFVTGEVVDPTGASTLRAKFEAAQAEDSSVSLSDFEDGSDTFIDFSKHTLKMYYLERGAHISSLSLKFNMPILPKHSLNVEKTLSGDKIPQLGNPDFKFQVLDESNNIKLANRTFSIYDMSSGKLVSTSETDEYGCFSIKAGQRATFEGLEANQGQFKVQELLDKEYFEQYCNVTVDGTVYTTDLIQSDIVIGTQEFKGFSSPEKDIADGILYYVFDNEIDLNEYGSLSVTKTIEDGYTFDSGYNPVFKMNIQLDDQLIPVGTVYSIGNTDHTVVEAGIIELRANETAIINEIIAGSQYYIEEDADSSEGYCGVIYENNSGIISNKTTSQVTITNIPGVILPEAGGNRLIISSLGYTLLIISTLRLIKRFKHSK